MIARNESIIGDITDQKKGERKQTQQQKKKVKQKYSKQMNQNGFAAMFSCWSLRCWQMLHSKIRQLTEMKHTLLLLLLEVDKMLITWALHQISSSLHWWWPLCVEFFFQRRKIKTRANNKNTASKSRIFSSSGGIAVREKWCELIFVCWDTKEAVSYVWGFFWFWERVKCLWMKDCDDSQLATM